MACEIANGRAISCLESVGGVRNVFFVNNAAMGLLTIDADGQLTDNATAASAYKYALRSETSEYVETITVSPDNGTVFYEQTLTLSLPNLSKDALKYLKLLAQGRFQVFVEDNNVIEAKGFGQTYLMGAHNGATVTGGTVSIGKAYGDMSGYNLTITAKERTAANILEVGTTTQFDALTTGGITVVTA